MVREKEIIVFAVWHHQVEQVVHQYGPQLADKIVDDITNPVDFN